MLKLQNISDVAKLENTNMITGMKTASTPEPLHWPLYDAATSTFTHVIACPATRRAAVIDSVLDYDSASARTSERSIDRVVELLARERLALDWILETHAHADHMSGAARLKERAGGSVAIGEGIRSVQAHFVRVFDVAGDVATDGSQFDRLWRDGDTFAVGQLTVRVLATPGHTNDSVTYVVARHAFVGDTLFRPDYGTARCDFPGGNALRLYESINRLYSLGPSTVLHFCHDYQSSSGVPIESATVAEQMAGNIHVAGHTSAEEFVARREARDATLAAPALLIPSIQVNIRAGRLPRQAPNGVAYLKTPVNVIGARSRM